MTTARDLLERFRPAGAPGSPAAAGVPADRERSLREELEPVLDLLSPTESECDNARQQAQAVADRLRADAAARVAATLTSAHQRAEVARTEAAARQRRHSDHAAAAELDAAHHCAATVASRAAERSPALVVRAVAAVQRLLDEAPS
ncbi:hypothetical protein [Angustibacter sp. Root456]|uniref:hypothetical protein n=1 Tax=Angustibacter sp. Root456 TaxID=1736539 RepID=UPI0006FA485D|nr:hypothetical protein [Angustibacter sp. Root456]KQX64530.1 hypothetical protein ASD06_10285 [Angustibacter sp. Root456]